MLKLEDLGVAAYTAQAPNLTKGTLKAAARIVSVESRHAAWIRDLRGINPAPDAAEPPLDAAARDGHRQGQRVRAMRLSDIDRDDAIAEALDALHGTTRAAFIRRCADRQRGAAGGVGRARLRPARAAATRRSSTTRSRSSTSRTRSTARSSGCGTLSGGLAEQARVVGAHERAHVKSLREVLGSRAVKRPRFDFRGATEDADSFRKTAVAFEDLAVAAYKAQAPLIQSRALLVPALGIHSVEARHAAWIRRLAGIVPAADAFDEPRSRRSTLAIVDDTNFVMRTRSRRKPKFTG